MFTGGGVWKTYVQNSIEKGVCTLFTRNNIKFLMFITWKYSRVKILTIPKMWVYRLLCVFFSKANERKIYFFNVLCLVL